MSVPQCICGGTYIATGQHAVVWTDCRTNSEPPATAPKQEVWQCNRCGTNTLVPSNGASS